MSLTCRVCGHRNADGTQFCTNAECGAYLGWEGQPTVSAPDPAGPAQRHGLHVQLADQTLAVAPGESCSTTATLLNTGTVVEGVRVVIGGPLGRWSTVEPAELSVYPEQSATCTVRFAPPRGPQCPAGIAGFVVQCASTVHPGLVATASGTVAVAAFHELTAQLAPTTTRGRRTTTHRVCLENRGNVVERVRVVASDAEGALTFEPADTTVDLVPGRLDLSVAVKAPLRWFGRPRAVPIQATAAPQAGSPPVRVDGTRHIVSVLPVWALVITLAAVLLGGGSAAAIQLAGGDGGGGEVTATPTEPGTPSPSSAEPTSAAPTTTPPVETSVSPTPEETTPTPQTTTEEQFREPAISHEDCIGYDPAALHVVDASDIGWQLLEGQSHAMLLLDDETDANDALALAQRHTSMCFFGRDNQRPNRRDYIFYYWRGSTGEQAAMSAEDCISYDPGSLQIFDVGEHGWQLVDESSSDPLLLLDSETDANNALTWAKAFTKQCFIGRDNERPDHRNYVVEYWQR